MAYPRCKSPPGYLSVADTAKLMRGFVVERSFTKERRVIDMRTGSVQDLIDAVLMFCGTPDQCYRQIIDFIEYTGGPGQLLWLAHAGPLPPRAAGRHTRPPPAAGVAPATGNN